MTEIQRPFLIAMGSNINLVQFLPPYPVIISKVHISSFMCMNMHVKWFCLHKISCTKNYDL